MLDIGGSPGTDWWAVQGVPDLSPGTRDKQKNMDGWKFVQTALRQ